MISINKYSEYCNVIFYYNKTILCRPIYINPNVQYTDLWKYFPFCIVTELWLRTLLLYGKYKNMGVYIHEPTLHFKQWNCIVIHFFLAKHTQLQAWYSHQGESFHWLVCFDFLSGWTADFQITLNHSQTNQSHNLSAWIMLQSCINLMLYGLSRTVWETWRFTTEELHQK